MEQILFYLQWIVFVIYIIFNIGFIYGCATRARSKGGVNYGTVATTMILTVVTIIFINKDLNKLNLLWVAPLIILTSPLNMIIFLIPVMGNLYLIATKAFLKIIMSVPYILMSIFALIGLTKWGFQGFVTGLGIGYLTSLLIGIVTLPITKIFDIGVIKRQYRKAIAIDFISQYKDSISSLKKFQSMKEDKIIDNFARFINDIQHTTMKIKDPVKAYPADCSYTEYRENFVRGGKSWAEKFVDEEENKLIQKYVEFCETAIYENFKKYT